MYINMIHLTNRCFSRIYGETTDLSQNEECALDLCPNSFFQGKNDLTFAIKNSRIRFTFLRKSLFLLNCKGMHKVFYKKSPNNIFMDK